MPKPLRHCLNYYHCRRALPPTARADARFCSAACRAQRYREKEREKVAKARATYRSPERRRCEQCGEPVSQMMWDYRREDARYCSHRCRQRAYVARKRARSA
jgi:predicted nucleic acid-binding Zn ribbon protein